MKVSYDLHIHTVLSPCAERDMTPNNIVNMAYVKGLDFIAITDHNAIHNIGAAMAVASELPIIVIPGMEVQTKEDVHMVCLFKCLADIQAFYDEIIIHITPMEHNVKRFGEQSIMDENDQIIGCLEQSVYASIQLPVEEIVDIAIKYGGGVIPAHLDRSSYSLISNLGFIPPDLPVTAIELSSACDEDKFLKQHKYLKNYHIIRNSDAHELTRISEPVNTLEVAEKTVEDFLKALFRF